jgi:hypothetical protein
MAGAELSDGELSAGHGARTIAVVPVSWTTLEFFRIAAASGATLKHLKPDEENLERFFLRITESAERGTRSTQPFAAGEPEASASG